jgi:hypothetical protein
MTPRGDPNRMAERCGFALVRRDVLHLIGVEGPS